MFINLRKSIRKMPNGSYQGYIHADKIVEAYPGFYKTEEGILLSRLFTFNSATTARKYTNLEFERVKTSLQH